MTNHNQSSTAQLGFDALLADADSDNRAREFERETGYLPDTYDEAIPHRKNAKPPPGKYSCS